MSTAKDYRPKTDQHIRAEYERESQACRPLTLRDIVIVFSVATALWAGIVWLAWRELSRDSYPPPPCPGEIVYTEWCGCLPPVYGDDC